MQMGCGQCAQQAVQTVPVLVPVLWLALAGLVTAVVKVGKKRK